MSRSTETKHLPKVNILLVRTVLPIATEYYKSRWLIGCK